MSRVLAIAFALLPAVALADEVGEHAPHGVPWAKLLFSTINLAIFLVIFVKYLAPFVVQLFEGRAIPVREWQATRRHRIATALAEADRAKRDAEALRAEWQRRLDHVGTELEAILKQARADIAVERDQILAAARRTAEAIQRDAERTADSEIRSAQEALRAEVARQALAIAEQLAPQRITAADQRRFVSEFVQEVQQR